MSDKTKQQNASDVVQLTRNHEGRQIGETFRRSEAEKLRIPEDALRDLADDRSMRGGGQTNR